MPNIVTTKQVSQYLKLTESTVYKLASIGEIPAFKIGKSWRFDMDEIIKKIRNKNTARIGRETGQKKAAGFRENNSSGNKDSL